MNFITDTMSRQFTDEHFAAGVLLNCMMGFVENWSRNAPIFALGQFQKFFLPLSVNSQFVAGLLSVYLSLTFTSLTKATTLHLQLLVKASLYFLVET